MAYTSSNKDNECLRLLNGQLLHEILFPQTSSQWLTIEPSADSFEPDPFEEFESS